MYPGLEYASVNHRHFAEMLDRMGLSVSAVDAEEGRKVLARSVALVQDYRATLEEAWQLSFIDRYTVEGGTVRYGTVRSKVVMYGTVRSKVVPRPRPGGRSPDRL